MLGYALAIPGAALLAGGAVLEYSSRATFAGVRDGSVPSYRSARYTDTAGERPDGSIVTGNALHVFAICALVIGGTLEAFGVPILIANRDEGPVPALPVTIAATARGVTIEGGF